MGSRPCRLPKRGHLWTRRGETPAGVHGGSLAMRRNAPEKGNAAPPTQRGTAAASSLGEHGVHAVASVLLLRPCAGSPLRGRGRRGTDQEGVEPRPARGRRVDEVETGPVADLLAGRIGDDLV
jgi:hypothetical protein